MSRESEPKILFSAEVIAKTLNRLASEISRDYRDKNSLLLGVLNGSFIFMADLSRLLDFPLEIDFIQLSSYRWGKTDAGHLMLIKEPAARLAGRHVLVIEDIVDSGWSVSFLRDYLGKLGAFSVKVCALADKPSRRHIPVKIDYTGFTVPDKFIIGYGMDCDEKFRNLPFIGYIET